MDKTTAMYILELDSDIIHRWCRNINKSIETARVISFTLEDVLNTPSPNGFVAIRRYLNLNICSEGIQFWEEVSKNYEEDCI